MEITITRKLAPLAFAVLTLMPGPAAFAAIDFVGSLSPDGGFSTPVAQGDGSGLGVFIQVYSPGVTDLPGQGPGIQCSVEWGKEGEPRSDLAMSYYADIGNNDAYTAMLPTGALVPGNHAFTVWCSDDGDATRVYRDGADGILSITPLPTPPPGDAIVQLFEWRWTDIAQECAFLAERGYSAVQVPPPSEHLTQFAVSGRPWWVRYQPMSYQLESRSGSAGEFAEMVASCNAAGIDVYVDAVINHMTNAGFSAVGTAGTIYSFGSYTYAGTYGPVDFHMCGTDPGGPFENDILDFADRFQVQLCELVGLADIDTSADGPRATLRAYLQGLLDLGVAGFRVDAAKHIASSDLEALFDGLAPAPYVYQEVIDSSSEQVRAWEYLVNGDVAEFAYASIVAQAFGAGSGCPGPNIASLESLGAGLLGTDNAVVFLDNHDTQRGGGCALTFQDGDDLYKLGSVFALAYPYGHARVMSSYYFSDPDGAPPNDNGVTREIYVDGEPVGCNATDWVCEHRRTAIANMARFRAVTRDEPLSGWWDDGSNRIAFGRGVSGYVAINRDGSGFTRTYDTDMAAGTYCNVVRYDVVDGVCTVPGTGAVAPGEDLIVVAEDGRIVDQLLAGTSAFAIHAASVASLPDTDGDGVTDDIDNCTEIDNPDQRDSNADGFGNVCDPDLDNDGQVNFLDLGLIKEAMFSAPGDANWNRDADLDGDGVVNFIDLGIMKSFFFGPPGPGIGLPPEECGPDDPGSDPADAFGAEMFFRGSAAGDWGAVQGLNNFVNQGNDVYVAEFEVTAGTYDYKVADAGWSIERTNVVDTLVPGVPLTLQDNGAGSPNGVLSIPADGCYSFTLETIDTDFPVLTLEQRP